MLNQDRHKKGKKKRVHLQVKTTYFHSGLSDYIEYHIARCIQFALSCTYLSFRVYNRQGDLWLIALTFTRDMKKTYKGKVHTDLHNGLLFFLDRVHDEPYYRVRFKGKFIKKDQCACNTCLNSVKKIKKTPFLYFVKHLIRE